MSEPRTQTLEVPGARLRYDIRDAEGEPTAPPLLMIALPMDATGFTTLAGHFPDRTVVTYDPRGIGRSERTDAVEESTDEQHADDVHRLISALDTGPVDIFGSSGGAITGLVLVARHPEQVRTLVAHEPPSTYLLPDAEQAQAAFDHVQETYQREGFGPAMAKFLVLSSMKGPIPADFAPRALPSSGSRQRTTALATMRCSEKTTARRATCTTSAHSARRRPASSSEPEPSPRAK
jgi:pimeloyl-ACP methyl ester carboxylesterase